MALRDLRNDLPMAFSVEAVLKPGPVFFSEGEFGTLVGGRLLKKKHCWAGMNFEVVFDDFDDLSLLLSCFIPKICCLEVTKSVGSTFGSMLGVIYVRAFRLFSRTNLRHS